MPRTYQEELKFIERIDDYTFRIKKEFQPNMLVSSFSYLLHLPHLCQSICCYLRKNYHVFSKYWKFRPNICIDCR